MLLVDVADLIIYGQALVWVDRVPYFNAGFRMLSHPLTDPTGTKTGLMMLVYG